MGAEQNLVRTLMFSNCPLEGAGIALSFQLSLQPISKPSCTNFPEDKNHPRCLLKMLSCGESESEDSRVCVPKQEARWFSYQGSTGHDVLKDAMGFSIPNHIKHPSQLCGNGGGLWALPGPHWLNHPAGFLHSPEAQPQPPELTIKIRVYE